MLATSAAAGTGPPPGARAGALLHEYLLAAAPGRPDAPAIDGAAGRWTYPELTTRSAEYAQVLLDHGLRNGDRLLLELHASPEAVALIIAAASLGVVFVCVSPELPGRRKQHILDRVEAVAVVETSRQWQEADVEVRGRLGKESQLILTGAVPGDRQQVPPRPDSLAYVVFTSGSTGEPKGIMMTHSAVVHFWVGIRQFGVAPDVRLGTVAPLQFDFSLLDLGMALGDGGCLVQVPSILLQQPRGFADYLRRYDVTQMNGVPSIWRETLSSDSASLLRDTRLETVLYAGEAFPLHQLQLLRQMLPGLRIVNAFGHSESIACAYHVLPDPIPHIGSRVPFGTEAIAGMRMYVLSSALEPVAPHEVGEIYVEGDALFTGYWKDPASTAAALVDSPVTPGLRAFRSGDLGFVDEAGQHYFHSRRDTQVKIRGNRVELSEIELHLERHGWVREAACTLLSGDDPAVAAFVCLTEPTAADEVTAALRTHCAEALPRYMRPLRYEVLDRLPLTKNGKIDRAALSRRLAVKA